MTRTALAIAALLALAACSSEDDPCSVRGEGDAPRFFVCGDDVIGPCFAEVPEGDTATDYFGADGYFCRAFR